MSEEQALFDLANQVAKPYTTKLFIKIKSSLKESISETKDLPKKFFNNTSPSITDKTDEVIQNKSAFKKSKADSSAHDDYTKEEKEAILNILRNAN